MLPLARIALLAAAALTSAGAAAGAPPHFCGTETCSPADAGLRPITLGARPGAVARGSGGPCAEDGSRIDILIAYTPNALAAVGGVAAMQALADDSIGELNTALAASGVATTAVLVGLEPVAQNASGFSSSDLAGLRDPGDGVFDEVHALRDDRNADLVSLFVASSDVCGRAYIGVLPGAVGFEDLGFSIVLQSCATGGVHAFTHEIGHNLGLLHDFQAQPCQSGARPWARGYVAPDGSFRTVMAASSSAPTELMFSSPDVDVGGQPAGIAFDDEFGADSALALLDAVAVVARFRDRDRNGNGQCDADEIAAGSLTDCDANGVPDGFDQDFNRNGIPDACDIASGTSADADLDGVPDEVEVPVLHVAEFGGLLAQTGVSWDHAIADLQDAFALARASGDVEEIWVKYGTYFTGPPGARAVFFRPPDGAAVRGGFLGGETDPAQRPATAPPTVLTGDTMFNDGGGFTNREDNALHVLYVRDNQETIELDRLTVWGGQADDGTNCSHNSTGGGIFTLLADVIIRDCVFQDNQGVTGAAASIQDQTVIRVLGSDFSYNRSVTQWGSFAPGPILVEGWAPVYFSGDRSGDENLFLNSTVTHNEVQEGVSGLFAIGGQPTIANSVFAHNTSSYPYVNAVSIRLADGARFINNVVADNTAPNASSSNATGFRGNTNDLVVKNSIFWNNTAGGVVHQQGNNFSFNSSRTGVVVDRVIVDAWDGTLPGVGSGDDPMFASAATGDYTLLAGSPAIDAGDSAALPADTLDLDSDTDTLEALPFDLAGNARFVDDPATADTGVGPGAAVDLGPLEFVPTTPACVADCDGSGALNLDDIDCFVAGFLAADLAAADCDGTGGLNLDDIDCFVSSFLAGCP